MKALIVDRRDAEITLNGQIISIAAGAERRDVPCTEVERLIVHSPARIDTSVLDRLWSQGAGVLILSGRRAEPTASFLGVPDGARRRRAPMRMRTDGEAGVSIARDLVLRTLAARGRALVDIASRRRGMALDVLAFYERMAELRAHLRRTRSLHCVRGVAGAASGAYLPVLERAFDPAPGLRARRGGPPSDPVSACLHLGETVLAFEASRQARFAGFEPAPGMLHAPAPGRDGLARDLIEPLLPRLDVMVWRCFAEETLQAEHCVQDADGQCVLGEAGRAVLYQAMERHMALWSRWLARTARICARRLASGMEGGGEA
ncbi:MAG: CRISPR-associated endonuclease Cas1 [Alphaproteobacteria bacterium]